MRLLCFFSCLAVAAVMARPEPPLFMGLPQQNQRALPLTAQAVEPHIYQELPQEHSYANFAVTPSMYGLPFLDTPALAIPPSTAIEMPQEDSYNAAHRHSSSQEHNTGYENGPTETQVHKHIYVHVPPKDFEEDEVIRPRVTHQRGPKQKHYKIVFIKAPTAPEMHTPIAAPPPQNEEKTLIYVLHKKPESHPNIIINTPEPTQPSKPEVYFIKYKNRRDEAPVYGPPSAIKEVKSRQSANDESNDFMPMDFSPYEIVTTTQQPQHQEEEQKPTFVNEESAEVYNAATNTNFISDEVQATTTAEPLNRYLAPETTLAPIMVKEMEEAIHLPVSSYGTPKRGRFFIKRRK